MKTAEELYNELDNAIMITGRISIEEREAIINHLRKTQRETLEAAADHWTSLAKLKWAIFKANHPEFKTRIITQKDLPHGI